MSNKNVVIFGGSGFVGSVVTNRLAKAGHRVQVVTRSRERCKHLWPIPTATVVEADVFNSAQIAGIVQRADVVINLIGILNEKRDNGEGFRKVHVELSKLVIDACKKAQVPRYLHMSALGAEPFAPSFYQRTKSEAESIALDAHGDTFAVTVFRPSVIFGPGDGLFNRFARLLKMTPFVFPLACAKTRFQPVYVGDVADAFRTSIDAKHSFGERYDLGGPEIKSLLEIVRYTNEICGTHRVIIPLGPTLSKIQANVFEYVPGKPFSRDNFRSAQEDNVCTLEKGLADFGIEPTSIESVVPVYLFGSERARYDDFRSQAHRGS